MGKRIRPRPRGLHCRRPHHPRPVESRIRETTETGGSMAIERNLIPVAPNSSAFTSPGVNIEELPSGVHTITGVATSIAAFVGWANQGPTDEATLIESWSDFEIQFGGLNSSSYLGNAVNEFFANG